MNSNLSFHLSIVFDNKCVEEGFLPGFGFSALIYNNLLYLIINLCFLRKYDILFKIK